MSLVAKFSPSVLAILASIFVLGEPAFAITNGVVDADNQFPNVGAIVLTKSLPDSDLSDFHTAPAVICSGTLIHPRVMLTAGHCTHKMATTIETGVVTLSDIRVSFSPDAFDRKTWLEVSELITHPGFRRQNDTGIDNWSGTDIGVVILKKPVTRVPPALLPRAFLLDDLWDDDALRSGSVGAPFLRVGYGKSVEGVKADGLRRFTISTFGSLTSQSLTLSTDEEQGEGGAGQHDSGSAVWWLDAESGWLTPVAVTSDRLGFDGGKLDLTGRLDVPVALDFLELVIEAVEAGAL